MSSPIAHTEVPSQGGWSVSPDFTRFECGQTRIDIRPNGPTHYVAKALTELRVHEPGESLELDALLRAGWPGERVSRRAGKNRVYVTVSTLRKMGFGADLETTPRGYRLNPAVTWQVREAG